MIEIRIYVDDKLKNICYNEYAALCNMISYTNTYGKDRIQIKRMTKITNDEEKRAWLETL